MMVGSWRRAESGVGQLDFFSALFELSGKSLNQRLLRRERQLDWTPFLTNNWEKVFFFYFDILF